MKRRFCVLNVFVWILFVFLEDIVLAEQYLFDGYGINGTSFNNKNTGLITLQGELTISAYCLDMEDELVKGASYLPGADVGTELKGIILNAYPAIKDIEAIKAMADEWLKEKGLSGIVEINESALICAAQIAIWNVENDLDIGVLEEGASLEVKLAHYLLSRDYKGPDKPEIIIRTKIDFNEATQKYDAAFTCFLSNKNGQAVIDKEKTCFKKLPDGASEIVYQNGDKYIRAVRDIPPGSFLELTATARMTYCECFLLNSDTSQKLAGIIEKTTEIYKTSMEVFQEILPQPASKEEENPVGSPRLPKEMVFGFLLLLSATFLFLAIRIIKTRTKTKD